MQRRPLRRDAAGQPRPADPAPNGCSPERGIDGVSLRELNQAAGQKNVSGLQYHFGHKGCLLAASSPTCAGDRSPTAGDARAD